MTMNSERRAQLRHMAKLMMALADEEDIPFATGGIVDGPPPSFTGTIDDPWGKARPSGVHRPTAVPEAPGSSQKDPDMQGLVNSHPGSGGHTERHGSSGGVAFQLPFRGHGYAGASIQECVEGFHHKHGFPVNGSTEPWSREHGRMLQRLDAALVEWNIMFRQQEAFGVDLGMQRVSLIAEELGELARACSQGDPVAVFDALCDLNYVLHGTAVAFGMRLEEGTREVHRSNMTKDVGEFKPVKGQAYSAPNLKPILGWRCETDQPF